MKYLFWIGIAILLFFLIMQVLNAQEDIEIHKRTNMKGWHSHTDMHKIPVFKPLVDELFKMQNEIFQEEGKLSVEKINSFARQNGFLPGKYIENIRNKIALDFWTNGIANTDFITSNEFNRNVSLANQTRDVVLSLIHI